MQPLTLQASRKTKNTPAGNIPMHWIVRSLGECFSLASGDTKPIDTQSHPDAHHEIPVYGGNGVLGYASSRNSNLPEIIIGRVGEYCGVAHYVEGPHWTTDNALFTKDWSEELDIGFFYYLLQHLNLGRLRNKGGQPLISQKPIYEKKVGVPPWSEQRQIARILKEWDQALEQQEKLVVSNTERKQELMQQLLTGKARFKEFGGEPSRSVRIGSLLEECDRYVTWSDDAAYRFASIRRRSGGLFDRGTFYGREVKTKVLKLLKAGDFVISKRQVVHGAWAMVTKAFDGFGVSDEYDVLVNRDPKVLDMRFFDYLSQTRRLWHMAFLASNGVHVEKLIFDFDDFAKEKVRIPPTAKEQAKIVDVLSTCDRGIELLQKQLAALKEQKRGLMQKLLTGEVRVKC